MNPQAFTAALLNRAEEKGDLPILNASMARVQRISADPQAHAMELAQTVLKDANLSTKLLRLANSPAYNRGLGRITTVSRAVVLLGFETIKNLCLTVKLIENFQAEHPAIGMQAMIARAYFTAGLVRELAMKCGVRDAEESYLSGLLHNLGEIALAYFVPEKFNELLLSQRDTGNAWQQVQFKVLGLTLDDLGRQLAGAWNFSPKILATMSPYTATADGVVRKREELDHAMASLASQIIGKLYVEQRESSATMRELIEALAQVTGIPRDTVDHALLSAFQASCDLASEYGLPQRALQPPLRDSDDDMLNRLSREFGFYANRSRASSGEAATGTAGQAHRTVAQVTSTAVAAAPRHLGDPEVQLAILQEITRILIAGAPLNAVLMQVLEGLHRGVGLQRAALSLLSPDGTAYQARIALARDTDTVKTALAGKYDERADFFSRVMSTGCELRVSTADSIANNGLSTERANSLGVGSFLVAGLRSGARPIGFFYGDNFPAGSPISADQEQGFRHFVAQARLAIQLRG
jgi:HD-like signal output (HDOD) protein